MEVRRYEMKATQLERRSVKERAEAEAFGRALARERSKTKAFEGEKRALEGRLVGLLRRKRGAEGIETAKLSAGLVTGQARRLRDQKANEALAGKSLREGVERLGRTERQRKEVGSRIEGLRAKERERVADEELDDLFETRAAGKRVEVREEAGVAPERRADRDAADASPDSFSPFSSSASPSRDERGAEAPRSASAEPSEARSSSPEPQAADVLEFHYTTAGGKRVEVELAQASSVGVHVLVRTRRAADAALLRLERSALQRALESRGVKVENLRVVGAPTRGEEVL